MKLTKLFVSKNWSNFSLRAVLATVINQLRLLTKFPENASLTNNMLDSKHPMFSGRPKGENRGNGGRP